MNIAHLTLLHGYNYGGMLQAYATQAILKSHGHRVLTLDYHPWKRHDLLRKSSLFCKPLYERARRLLDKRDFSGVDAFDEFRRENFVFSPPCQTSRQPGRVCEDMDCAVVGSDQVWSAAWRRAPYFLDFDLPNHCKRVSLAACCGSPSPDPEYRGYFGKTISRFDAISVRNDFTAQLVMECTGRSADVLCDPTLACDVPVKPVAGTPGDYILVYVINRPKSLPLAGQAIRRLKNETGLSVVSIPPTEMKGRESLPCDSVAGEISPFQWAWLVANASFVITDSFHGTLFSAKNHKPFMILDSGFSANNRLHAIADELGMRSSVVSGSNLAGFERLSESSEKWRKVDSVIESKAEVYHGFVARHISK